MRRSHGDRERRRQLHDIPSDGPPSARFTVPYGTGGIGDDPGRRGPIDPRHDHLQRLREALTATGDYVVRLVEYHTKPPELHIRRLGAPRLAEDIGAECDHDGTWHLTWSWGDRICPADDIETALVSIGHVLTIRI